MTKKLLDRLLFGAFIAALILFAAPAGFGGSTSYVVVDGTSMEPTYHHGDLVIARQRDTYGVGDVITYDAPVGVTYRVIHRVTEVTDDGYLTRGDNRDQRDGWIVPFDAVHGSSAIIVPKGGTLVTVLRSPPLLVAVFAGWVTLTLLTRRERRSAQAADDASVEGEVQGAEAPDPAPATSGSRLWTAVLFTGMGVLGLSAGVLVANAASLAVDGGTLQAFDLAGPDHPPPPEPPPATEVTVTVEWRLFNNGGQQRSQQPVSDEVHVVPVGDEYLVPAREGRYQNQPYREVACASVAVDEPAGDWYGSGTFEATATGTHIVCLQQQTGGS